MLRFTPCRYIAGVRDYPTCNTSSANALTHFGHWSTLELLLHGPHEYVIHVHVVWGRQRPSDSLRVQRSQSQKLDDVIGARPCNHLMHWIFQLFCDMTLHS